MWTLAQWSQLDHPQSNRWWGLVNRWILLQSWHSLLWWIQYRSVRSPFINDEPRLSDSARCDQNGCDQLWLRTRLAGWDHFPAIFSSLAIGAALAQALPWMPRLTACVVVATSITVILENPLISVIILILLLPIQFSIFIILVCYLTSYLTKHYQFLRP